MSPTFKMSTVIDDLRRNLVRYREYLLRQTPRMQQQRQEEEPVAADLDYQRILKRSTPTDPDTKTKAAIMRVNEALSSAQLYEPVRVDTLLLDAEEQRDLKYPRQTKLRRLKLMASGWCRL